MAKAKSESEKWFDAIPSADPPGRPQLVPEIGVTIECRIVVKSLQDWEYVRDTLERCREYGAANVTDYKVFAPPATK